MTETTGEAEPVQPCCGGYREHRYRCPARIWPATATPEIRRQAVRGDCIAPAHARMEDRGVRLLDYQQRKRLTEILAQVWDDGFGYGRRIREDGSEGKTEKGVVFKHHAGTDTATARGATRKNGGAAILKARGWYWLNSVQAYVIKDQYVAPGTAAQEVREAAEVLRASGLTVERKSTRLNSSHLGISY